MVVLGVLWWSTNVDMPKHVPDACDERGDRTRAGISRHTPNDAQSAHDECGDSRLHLREEGCGEGGEKRDQRLVD